MTIPNDNPMLSIEELFGLKRDIPEPKKPDYNTDIIPWFNIGDGHLGMISYEHEVGHNFDLSIAKRDLMMEMKTLIDREPQCER